MSKSRMWVCLAGLSILSVAALTGCSLFGPKEALPEEGNVIPTPVAGTEVGTVAENRAADTPEVSTKRYLQDSIAALVSDQQFKIDLRQRYQDPALTEKELKSLVAAIAILEDRTAINAKENSGSAAVDVDVRVSYANGDTASLTCNYNINLRKVTDDSGAVVWYVISPDIFPLFAACHK